MESIREHFLFKIIPSFMAWEYNMPRIPFVFDDEAMEQLNNSLYYNRFISRDFDSRGRSSLEYLESVRKDYAEGKDGVYIVVHDSDEFFNLLDEILNKVYSNNYSHTVTDNIMRSIWLRMGVEDISNVEGFLRRELSFLQNDSVFEPYYELSHFGGNRVLAYHIQDNHEYFETNQNIVFAIRDFDDSVEGQNDYEFPAIHFGLTSIDGEPTCYIYGIQNIDSVHDEKIKNDIQSIRKKMRNKYVSGDFLIALSLFLDFLYDNQIRNVVVSPLQVFNYPYHQELSKNIENSFNSYSDEEKAHLEELYDLGDRSDKVLDYMYTKSMVDKFVHKEDIISKNKTERLIYSFYELQRIFPSFEIVSEPFVQGENLVLHLKGKTDIISDLNNKKRTF